jgi:hypothetical protein
MVSGETVTAPDAVTSRRRNITGAVCTALVALFLVFDTTLKVLSLAPAVEATTALGYPAESVTWIGLIELVCLVLYLVPRTAVLGAQLMTGYLGGAIATHVRLSNPLLTHTLFPIMSRCCCGAARTCAKSGFARCCRSGVEDHASGVRRRVAAWTAARSFCAD